MYFNTRRILYRNLSFLMVVIYFALLFLTVKNERGQQIVDLAGDISFFFVILFSTLWMKRQGLYICLLLSIIHFNIDLLMSPFFYTFSSIGTIQILRNLNLWIIISIFAIFILSSSEKSPIGFLKKEKPIKDYLIIVPTVLIIAASQFIVRQL
jgi:hypothetical protein